MKTNRILFIAFLIFGLFAFQKVNYAQNYLFQNDAIQLFGDVDISRVYEGTIGVYTPTHHMDCIYYYLNLAISNPQNVQFYVNGSSVSAYQDGDHWRLNASFAEATSYTFSVRITYSQHYSNYNNGNWSATWDYATGM
jgi:hypothetical protein